MDLKQTHNKHLQNRLIVLTIYIFICFSIYVSFTETFALQHRLAKDAMK